MSDINNMNVGIRWYVAHTYAGYENKVKDSLEKIIENRHLEDLIFDIKIPVEKVVTEKKKRRSKNASADGEAIDGEVEQVVEEISSMTLYSLSRMLSILSTSVAFSSMALSASRSVRSTSRRDWMS
jgi:transcription antitermination factor NusG